MESVRTRYIVLALLWGCLATAWMTHGASVVSTSTKQLGPDGRVRSTRQTNNSTDEDATSGGSGDTWLGANWYWLLVVLVAVFVFILLAIICCCYKQSSTLYGSGGRIQLSSMKAAMPSPNLTGFTSPVSTSVGDRESYHGNLVVSPGVLSTEQTPVASPQLHFASSSSQQQHHQQHYHRSPHNSVGSRHSYRRKNQSPGNSSGSEETIRHATGTPSISSFASVSSSLNGKISRAQSFTGVGQPRLNRWRSGSQVKVISLSRGASSLSVTSATSNSSTHSAASNQSACSHGALQPDSSQHAYLAVDVQVRVNKEMTQREKYKYTAVVLAESAAKLAQSAASYGEEPIVPMTKHKIRSSHRRYYSTTAGLRQTNNESPTRKASPSHSLPMPVSHSINYTNGNILHSKEAPIASLDNCVRGGQCTTERLRPTSPSGKDSGDEILFTPKQSLTGTTEIIGPPSSTNHHHKLPVDRDRGRTKKSKAVTNNGTDEVKKKKRHLHQSTPTAQAPKELARFVGNEVLEMPLHMRIPQLSTDRQSPDSTSQPAPVHPPSDFSITTPSGTTDEQIPDDRPSVKVDDNKDERNGDDGNKEKTKKKTPVASSLVSSSRLKRTTSASTHLSSSLSSVNDELSHSHGQESSNLRRQYSVPNIPQSLSSSHGSYIPRPLSGTSLSASGYAPSGASTNTLDSISTINKTSEHYHNNENTFSYPLRKMLEAEHDHSGATDPQFSVNGHYFSGTSSAASSGMAEKAPVSPALPFISTNGFSATYSNSNHITMYGGRPSLTGLASAEV